MQKFWVVAALAVIAGLGWAWISAVQAAYREHVSYMTEFCRAEAQIYLYEAKGDPSLVNCEMRFWDGGVAYFDVAGGPFLKFSCPVDELDWSSQNMDRCEFVVR